MSLQNVVAIHQIAVETFPLENLEFKGAFVQYVLRVCVCVFVCKETKGSCKMFELTQLHHQHIFKSHRDILFLKS